MSVSDKTFDEILSESLETEFATHTIGFGGSVGINDVETLENAMAFWSTNQQLCCQALTTNNDSGLADLNEACGAEFTSVSEVCHFIKQLRIQLLGIPS